MNTKNIFTTLGMFTILLVSLTMVSASSIAVSTIGSVDIIEDLPTTVVPGQEYNITLNITNNVNESLIFEWKNTTTIDWTVFPENLTLEDTTTIDNVSGNLSARLRVPADFVGNEDKNIGINVWNVSSGNLIGTLTKEITYNYTAPVVTLPGCTDSSANNYNSTANTDDGSCTYDEPESICISGEQGDLKIASLDLNNLGEGTDNEWDILDEIEITVEIENTNRDDNVNDVLVEIIIEDTSGNDVTSDFDIEDDQIDLGRIKDDDSEEAVFNIREVPADLDEGTYRIYFKAYSDRDEENQCVSISSKLSDDEYEEIEVIREDDPAVIISSNEAKILASCGDKNSEITFDVVNVGSDKEEKVLVIVENKALGIYETEVINDLRSGKKKELTFYFDVPEGLQKDKYDLDIRTYFDYDDGDELDTTSYDDGSDDIDRDFSTRLEIISCKGPEPGVGVNLVSESPMVGEELVVKMVVKNNDNNDANFVFSASNFEPWADMVSVTPQTASIDSGKTQEVLVTLKPKESGVKSFNINTIVDGETYVQPVSVNIGGEEEGTTKIDPITMYLIIGIVALLLLILLILIIKSLGRTKKVSY